MASQFDEITDEQGTAGPFFSQGFQVPDEVDFTTYASGTGAFGTSITAWKGVEFWLGGSNYMSIARVSWSHASGFTTQGTNTLTGITLTDVDGTIADQNGNCAIFSISNNRLVLNSATVGANIVKNGVCYMNYTKP